MNSRRGELPVRAALWSDESAASLASMSPARKPSEPLRRILENAGLLIFATLAVMSLALGRYTGALVWSGALLVFFAHAWEGRFPSRIAAPSQDDDGAPARSRRFNALRWIGVLLAFSGAIALAL
ncbi:MAG TPA: hypothetical protein PLE54_04475 [Burkholderiaceae bacterium]|nr:hypothetical protein [Burkholderiaceae bacterium]